MMRHYLLPIGILASACGLLAGATTAQAVSETSVSVTGTNAGTCPIIAPCLTFAYAHGQTTAGGTIHVLSSGTFGPLNIVKSISIIASDSGSGTTSVMIDRSAAANNGVYGVLANGSNVTIRIGDSTVSRNDTGLHILNDARIVRDQQGGRQRQRRRADVNDSVQIDRRAMRGR